MLFSFCIHETNCMEFRKWKEYVKETLEYTEDSIESNQFIDQLRQLKNTTVFLINPDMDFPPPKKPYRYDKYFCKDILPIDYYDMINMEVIDILEKNNIHVVTYSSSLHHPNITCIPLGIYHQFHHFHLKREKTILCYMNMGIPCDRWFGNPRKEIPVKPFMVQKSNLSIDAFYEDISKSKFMICPRGCGIDTYRMWDCIVLGCIPIVKKYHGHHAFEDLPILFVDHYDITEAQLHETYEAFSKKTFHYEKCTMDYWIDTIKRRMESGS